MKRRTRKAKPGELREIKIIENLERLSRRPESRLDVQRFLENLSPSTEVYIKHLIESGPSSLLSAAKALSLKTRDIEEALKELELGISKLK